MTEIRKCHEYDIEDTGRFYDDVAYWLTNHANYPQWIYQVYPNEESVEQQIKARAQYIYTIDETTYGAFALTNKPQGAFHKGQWSKDLSDGSYMVIHALAIHPKSQRQGIASEIIRFCINCAKRQGFKAIRLDVIPNNIPARSLFEKNGFHYVGDVDLEVGIKDIPAFSLYEYNFS
ncbi:MAG: GNAT family N-acetyltransferase [Faecalicoccus sp.]|nr:GNAT family N-acetyltransferase [Faecalicoccus sp.]